MLIVDECEQGGFLSALLASGLLLWLGMTKHNAKNITKRIKIFMAFTFLSGNVFSWQVLAHFINQNCLPDLLMHCFDNESIVGNSLIFVQQYLFIVV